jgi:hypothetical protein
MDFFCGTAIGIWCLQAAAGPGRSALSGVATELAMVLDGIDVSKLKRVPRYTRISDENKEKNIGLRNSQAWRL